MKKRWCSILTALLLLLPLAAMPASADAGPKPSVVVELTGLEGRTCWGTLLSQQEGTGPYGRFSEGETVEGPEKDRALRAMRPLDQRAFTCWTSRRTAPTGNSAGPTTRPTPIRSPSGFQRRTPWR